MRSAAGSLSLRGSHTQYAPIDDSVADKGIGAWKTASLLVKACLGAGSFEFPWGFAQAGLWLSLGIVFFFASV